MKSESANAAKMLLHPYLYITAPISLIMQGPLPYKEAISGQNCNYEIWNSRSKVVTCANDVKNNNVIAQQ